MGLRDYITCILLQDYRIMGFHFLENSILRTLSSLVWSHNIGTFTLCVTLPFLFVKFAFVFVWHRIFFKCETFQIDFRSWGELIVVTIVKRWGICKWDAFLKIHHLFCWPTKLKACLASHIFQQSFVIFLVTSIGKHPKNM